MRGIDHCGKGLFVVWFFFSLTLPSSRNIASCGCAFSYGEEGLKGGAGRGGGPGNIFDVLFGEGRGRGGPSGPPRTSDVLFQMKVTLKELYNGNHRRLAVNRRCLCTTCKA